MASDGNRPRLPDTDDPFILLGIETDAGDRQVRQAYARLIRIYRPDRSPSEFQRVHAAFEAIRHLRQNGAAPDSIRFERRTLVDAPANATRSESTADAADRDPQLEAARRVDTQLDEVVAAHDAGQPLRAAAIIEALLAQNPPLDVLFRDRPTQDAVLRSVRLTWARLRRLGTHPLEAAAAWRAAWEHAFDHDLDAALALLDDEQLRLDAADHPELAAMCVRRIGALAWRKSFGAEAMLASYAHALPRHDGIDWLLDSVGVELAAINALASQRELRGVFDDVRTLLVALRIRDQQECVQAAQQLYDRLAGDPDQMMAELDGLESTHDLGALFELIYSYLPASFTSLEDIPKPRFELLSGTLFDAGARPQRWKALGGASGVAVVAGLTIGILPVLGVAGAVVGLGLATERWRYKKEIRPRLARAILALPATTGVIARWVRLNSKLAGRLSRFEPGIENDSALYTFSMFAVLAAAVGSED